MLSFIVILVLSYLVGSIPTSVMISKWFKGFDVRHHGSGNAGGTNAVRVMGWKVGVPVGLFDIVKGVIAVAVVATIRLGADPLPVPDLTMQLLAGLAAILGHNWTIFASFRGGKGVATTAGMLLAVYPLAMLICLGVFLAVYFTSRYVSLSSIVSTSSVPASLFLMDKFHIKDIPNALIWFTLAAAILIMYTHRENIQRLISGTENTFNRK